MLCRTKKEYLRELSRELANYFKKKDVRNIISDYEEFFDAGISEGKSEIEICGEFGDIQNLAREIAENQVDVKPKILKKGYLTAGILGLFLLFTLYLSDCEFFDKDYGIVMLSRIPMFFAPPLTVLFIKLYKKYEININEKILFVLSCIPFILGLQSYIYSYDYGAKFIFLIKVFLMLIIFIMIILALRKEQPENMNLLPIFYIMMGLLKTLNEIVFDTTRGTSMVHVYNECMTPLFTGVLFASVIYIFSFWRKSAPKFKIPKFKIMTEQEERDK